MQINFTYFKEQEKLLFRRNFFIHFFMRQGFIVCNLDYFSIHDCPFSSFQTLGLRPCPFELLYLICEHPYIL